MIAPKPVLVALMLGSVYLCAAATESRIPLKDPIYRVSDVFPLGEDFFVLDQQNHPLIRINSRGEILAVRKGNGQGPGEFFMPRCVAASKQYVFVGDFNKIHVFDPQLNFIRTFKTFNNPQDFLIQGDTLVASMVKYPLEPHAIYIMDFNGKVLSHFFKHGVADQLAEPFIAMNEAGQFFAQPRTRFGLVRTGPGLKNQDLPLPKPLFYKDYQSPGKFLGKYGNNRSAVLKWKTTWTEASGLALVKDRYFVLCYSQLQSDLLTTDYYYVVYDNKENKTLGKAMRAPGPLVCGTDAAYFTLVEEALGSAGTDMYLVRVPIGNGP